jgi:hypothetical protein
VGALGAAVASLCGLDAKSQFEAAVMRIKPFLETGNEPHDLHSVTSGQPSHRLARAQAEQRQRQPQEAHMETFPRQPSTGQPSSVQPTSVQPGPAQPSSGQQRPGQPTQTQPSLIEQLGQEHPGASMQIPPSESLPQPDQHLSESDPNDPERGRLG